MKWTEPWDFERDVVRKLDRIIHLLTLQLNQETRMAVDLTALTAEVANNTTVDGSIMQLVANLAQQIAALAAGTTDTATQAALNALVTTLQQNDAAIAATVTANTQTPPPAPAPAS